MTLPHYTSRQRGTYTADYGTPQEVIGLVGKLFGSIDVDLCSSDEHNKIVQAEEYYSSDRPCPNVISGYDGDVWWCNPPGPLPEVRRFWDIWRNGIDGFAQGAFLVFNVDHFRQLNLRSGLTCLFFAKRLRFVGAESTAAHASVLVSTCYHNLMHGFGTVLRS